MSQYERYFDAVLVPELVSELSYGPHTDVDALTDAQKLEVSLEQVQRHGLKRLVGKRVGLEHQTAAEAAGRIHRPYIDTSRNPPSLNAELIIDKRDVVEQMDKGLLGLSLTHTVDVDDPIDSFDPEEVSLVHIPLRPNSYIIRQLENKSDAIGSGVEFGRRPNRFRVCASGTIPKALPSLNMSDAADVAAAAAAAAAPDAEAMQVDNSAPPPSTSAPAAAEAEAAASTDDDDVEKKKKKKNKKQGVVSFRAQKKNETDGQYEIARLAYMSKHDKTGGGHAAVGNTIEYIAKAERTMDELRKANRKLEKQMGKEKTEYLEAIARKSALLDPLIHNLQQSHGHLNPNRISVRASGTTHPTAAADDAIAQLAQFAGDVNNARMADNPKRPPPSDATLSEMKAMMAQLVQQNQQLQKQQNKQRATPVGGVPQRSRMTKADVQRLSRRRLKEMKNRRMQDDEEDEEDDAQSEEDDNEGDEQGDTAMQAEAEEQGNNDDEDDDDDDDEAYENAPVKHARADARGRKTQYTEVYSDEDDDDDNQVHWGVDRSGNRVQLRSWDSDKKARQAFYDGIFNGREEQLRTGRLSNFNPQTGKYHTSDYTRDLSHPPINARPVHLTVDSRAKHRYEKKMRNTPGVHNNKSFTVKASGSYVQNPGLVHEQIRHSWVVQALAGKVDMFKNVNQAVVMRNVQSGPDARDENGNFVYDANAPQNTVRGVAYADKVFASGKMPSYFNCHAPVDGLKQLYGY